MTSISMVVPSWHYWAEPLKLQPMWDMYYATLLSERLPEHDISVLDMRGPEVDKSGAGLPERDIYVHWIMKSADAPTVYNVVATLKRRFPKAVHIAGGTHVNTLTDDARLHFDTLILGSGEEMLIQAVRDATAGKLEALYRAPSKTVFSDYSHPQRSFLPRERVVGPDQFKQHGGLLSTAIYFSRGCAFKCNFCVYNAPGNFEWRTPCQIIDEVEYLKREYGIQAVNLRDEVAVPPSRSTAIAHLEALGSTGVKWRGQSIPIGTEEIVKLAAESGCLELALGIESVDSDVVLQIANKPSKSIEKNRQYIELLKKYGIKVKLCMIIGLPGESPMVRERTLKFLEEVQPDYVAVSGLDPIPGSTFHAEPEKFGIKSIDSDLSKHQHLMYRFGEKEHVGLPFEFAEQTPWGPANSSEKIHEDIKAIQAFVRENGWYY